MGSPLGLYNLVDKDGKPVTRNYTVYNGGAKGIGQKVKSLFDNTTVFSPFPAGAIDPGTGTSLKIKKWADIHNDDIYNTSISSVVKYTSQHPGMRLDFMDFAYLRNVGVYPNNRLIVARRFGAAVGNDLTKMTVPPFKTMVSWIPDTDDNFFSVQYHENWDEAEASYTNVLNDLGKSFKMPGSDNSSKLGDFLAGGLGLIPFPGLSEPIQRAVMKEFGLISDDPYNLPLGDPNLIRMAKKRTTVTPDEPGSGLSCDIEIKMVVEYEQKFINGVDPTLAYMDILQNAIYFGTSDARFQMGKAFGEGANGLMKDLISGNYSKIFATLKKIVTSIFKRLRQFIGDLLDLLVAPFKEPDEDEDADPDAGTDAARAENANARLKAKSLLNAFFDISEKAVGAVVGKYKQRLLGITNALTGAPSTPWHITIGNPKKPVFCSGDMLLASVDMEMGKILGYNDLPSTVKFTLTFRNARPLGAQEIFNRLNTGRGRTVVSAAIQTEANIKADGTVDTSGGPKKKKIVTKTFESAPNTAENSKSPDYQYATTEGKGEPYFSFDPENQPGNVAQNQEPVNLAEAQRNDNGTVQTPAAGNQNQLAPSAGSGQPQLSGTQGPTTQTTDPTKPGQGNAPADNKNKKAKRSTKKGKGKSAPSTTAGSTPLSQSQINSAPNSQLQARSNTLKDENGGLSLQKRVLDQPPKNETAEQKDKRLKKKAEVEKKLLSNSKEEDSINKELVSRQNQQGPLIAGGNTNTGAGIPGFG
jgi:hypothetical protein